MFISSKLFAKNKYKDGIKILKHEKSNCNYDNLNKTVVIDNVHIQHYSHHIDSIIGKEKCYFSSMSEKIIMNEIHKKLRKKINHMYYLLNKIYVKLYFNHWNLLYKYDYYRKDISFRRYHPNLDKFQLSYLWGFRKGLQIISSYYLEAYNKCIKNAIRKWKLFLYIRKKELYYFFDKWNIKSSLIKLNRMKARRFLYLTKRCMIKIKKSLKLYYWEILKISLKEYKIHKFMKLILQCWKQYIDANRFYKRYLLKHCFYKIIQYNFQNNIYFEYLSQLVISKQNYYSIKLTFILWRKKYLKLKLLHRIFQSFFLAECSKAFNTWKYSNRTILKLPSPSKDIIIRKQSNKSRLYARKLGVPSHIQPLYSEKEKRLLSDKDHTIQDRIQYRWKKVSQFETKCEQKRELRKILRESNNKLAYCKHIIPIVEKIN